MPHGVKTISEIYAQPEIWQQCLAQLEATNLSDLIRERDPRAVEWVFIGCGTSYYLAQAAAASFAALLGAQARAVPASEALLFPSLVFPGGAAKHFPVLISRSGHTSEVLLVAKQMQEQKVEYLALTCDGRDLEQTSSRVLKLAVKEKSTVMTSSFTAMLLALQYVAAKIAGDGSFIYALKGLPEQLQGLLARYGPAVQQFAENDFEDITFLGQGALYGIASESALKVMESSSTYAQFFHTLEFRHGPKSIIAPGTLVGGLISETGFEAEVAVLREMKELGAMTLAVANGATPVLEAASDLLIELGLAVPELARLAMYVVWGQLLGSYRGLAKDLDPDNPRHLSRVVTI